MEEGLCWFQRTPGVYFSAFYRLTGLHGRLDKRCIWTHIIERTTGELVLTFNDVVGVNSPVTFTVEYIHTHLYRKSNHIIELLQYYTKTKLLNITR